MSITAHRQSESHSGTPRYLSQDDFFAVSKIPKCDCADYFVFAILIAFTALVMWNAHVREQQFSHDQIELQMAQIQSASNEITRLITTRGAQVRQFSIDHATLIQNLVENPEDYRSNELLLEKVKSRFPAAFIYTITDAAGIPILEDIESLVGEACINDIKNYSSMQSVSSDHSYDAYIHPQALNYHFDVMAPLSNPGIKGIFFVSFHGNVLADILNKHQLPHYQLFLLHHKNRDLIEVSAQGTRDKLDRDIRLNKPELTAIHSRYPVKGTLWDAVVVPDESILKTFNDRLFFESATEIAVFLFCGLLMLRFFRREENRRSLAEYALQQANDELENRVSDRTQELHQSNLDLEKFAYSASHDLQEPLRMVSSYLQLISKRYGGHLDEDGEKFIGFALDGATRMKQLINDLLEYSRVNTKGLDPVTIDLNQQLETIQKDLEVSITENNASITYENLPTIQADKTQIYRVFLNIISNALKYSGEAAVEIRIEARNVGEYWEFCICDNGIGISAKNHDRIFEIFQRLHAPDEYSGTGIGLALTRQIVRHHGGKLWVKSALGEGSCFYFTLPRTE